LAAAEDGYRSAEGLARLVEGLELLDDVIRAAGAAHARTARNLAATYAARIYGRIEKLVAGDAALPEPELEHYFKVVLAFDPVAAALPPSARALKIGVVRRLIDRYYEGHPAERKQQALRALENVEEE
jgi:hypothetical protein